MTAIIKAQMAVGVVLAVVAGPLLAHALMTGYVPSWWSGGICLLTSAVLVIAGLVSAKARDREIKLKATPAEAPVERPRDPSVPMLGALLVYKYQVITKSQLERALELQEKQGPNRQRLGEILVSMDLITRDQLREALEYQRLQAQRVRERSSSSGTAASR
jgi:hypothetical protein